MFGGELEETARQLVFRSRPQRANDIRRERRRRLRPIGDPSRELFVDPCPLRLGERLCLALRAPARDRDADDAGGGDANDVSTRAGMPDEDRGWGLGARG
jgi:hypothetical protein